MKVVVIGASGQLGTDLCKALQNAEVIPFTHVEVDITSLESVKTACQKYRPDVIINTAAYVRVDDCEDNRDKAFQVNALGARNVAVVAQELGAKLVHISTDYVFGGNVFASETKQSPNVNPVTANAAAQSPNPVHSSLRGVPKELGQRNNLLANDTTAESPQGGNGNPSLSQRENAIVPLREANRIAGDPSGCRDFLTPSGYTEFDPPSPLNVYGASKLAGEDFVRHLCTRYFIVRGSGLFGTAGSSGKGGNFVETMLRLGKERTEIKVVKDQIFSPTYTADMANKIAQIIPTEYYGIFHITNSGTCSWYEFTEEIIKLTGLHTKVIPITSNQYPQKAKRPAYSVLAHYHLRLLGMDDIRSWQEALNEYLSLRNIK
jgi:dTDP-4-dehydrorhamnose reductase